MTDEVMNFDELEGLLDEAESMLEEATSFQQIGKFSSHISKMVWDETGGIREVSTDEWKAFPKGQGYFKFLNLHVCVDTQEFNPSFERGYERRVQVSGAPWNRKNSDETYTRIPSDWEAIWEPSVKEVLGDKYTTMTAALKYLDGKYVRVLDVKQQPTKKQPEPSYNTAKLVEVYADRESAYAVAGKSSGTASAGESSYSEETVTNVKDLKEAGLDNKDIAKELDLGLADVVKILRA